MPTGKQYSMPPASLHFRIPTRPPGRSPTCGATATTCAGLYETPTLAEGESLDPRFPAPGRKDHRDRPQPGPGVAERIRIQTSFCRTTASRPLKPRSLGLKTTAVACARGLGYPVVLKIFSETITHKTDVGGVKLNLEDESSVRSAFQAIRPRWKRSPGPITFPASPCNPWCVSRATS